jgi:hypothetical protein
MYSYHIVAELRQFRGVPPRRTGASTGHAGPAGTESGRSGLTGMDRFFLAIMVAAVLLLIVASDLLVNGPAMQAPADVAMLPTSGRLVR